MEFSVSGQSVQGTLVTYSGTEHPKGRTEAWSVEWTCHGGGCPGLGATVLLEQRVHQERHSQEVTFKMRHEG